MNRPKQCLAALLAGVLTLSTLTACSSGGGNVQANNSLAEDGTWHPTSSINIRVPFAAGGSADTITRIAAKGMEQQYGQSVVVNNLTGANGAIAANDLNSKEASPTELMVAGIALFTLTPLFSPDIEMNLDDYEVVGSLVADDFILLTNPAKSGIESVEELLEYGKQERILCGANAAGGATHMLTNVFFGEAGVPCEVLSADSGAQNALAVASGDAVCCIVAASAATQYVQDGILLPIACFSPEPFTGYEGITVPTAHELGYDVEFKSCNFLLAKKGANPEVLDQMYQDMLAYRETEEFQTLAANAAYIPDNQNAQQVRETVEQAKDFCEDAFETYYTTSNP